MKIVLYAGYQSRPFNPDTLDEIGLGGTEQCIIYLAYYLTLQPNTEVYVVGEVISGDYDNVKYRTTQEFKQEVKSVDTIIAASYIHYLKEFEDIEFKNSIFWVHNTDYYTWWNGQDIKNHRELLTHPKLSTIICLTNWHKYKFVEQFPETFDRIEVIGNGIDRGHFVNVWPKLEMVNGKVFSNNFQYVHLKNSNQYVYTSHCERGLAKLLEDWPDIKQFNPNAILKISTPEYGLEYYNLYFKELVDNLEDVEFLGTLSRPQLYKLMAESSYWYYPSEYEETFCITALEMLGHKVQPITWEWGGLKETLHGFNTRHENEKINWNLVKDYLHYNTWKYIVKRKWFPLLNRLNMDLDYFYCLTLQANNNQPLYDKCNSVTMPKPYGYWNKQGFDGRTMTPEDLAKFGVKKHPRWKTDIDNNWWNREVTDGEVGCALSHVDTWVDAYARDMEITMILEEDFKQDIEVPWTQVNQLLEMGYDLIYLGRNALKADIEQPIKGVLGWVEPDYTYNSHAYILSRRGVQILVEEYIDQYKSEIFALDEFLSITFGMTHRQDILLEYEGKTRLKAAAPITNYFVQENSQGISNFNASQPEILQASNWEEWCDKYINPHMRKGQYRLMVDEIGPNVIEFPLFTEKFCNEIIELAEQHEWVTDRHLYYPTTDQTMESLGMQSIYQKVLEQFVYPIWIWFWELAGEDWNKLSSENFIAKYNTLNQGSLDLHHDDSVITLNVRLNDDFKGGGTYLPKYKTTLQPRKIGNVMSHPGQITHIHGGRPVEEGTRYILVTFTKKPQ
jgi:glycosyltransferase involved in cell wall biosynthesis/GR25 family glycosyltransferase involved in LPS biosynthesis